MKGNPWGVPRALPGSHDLQLLQHTLELWRKGHPIQCPRFDKALRNGRGDRSGWRACHADLLVLEGWFVGCPAGYEAERKEEGLEPPVTASELAYRKQTEEILRLSLIHISEPTRPY